MANSGQVRAVLHGPPGEPEGLGPSEIGLSLITVGAPTYVLRVSLLEWFHDGLSFFLVLF